MNLIKNKQTLNGDWILAGGKIERVLRNALSELNSSVNILSLLVRKASGTSVLGEDRKTSNIIEYTAVVGDDKVSGFGECYMMMFAHPELKVLYNTYMRIYWSLER